MAFPGVYGLGPEPHALDFWLASGKCPEGNAENDKPATKSLHLAFKAESREVVDAVHAAAM